MDPATLTLIASLIETLLVPGLAALPDVIAAAETAMGLLKTSTDPTPAEEATIRAGLDAAHAALQAAGTA